MGSRVSRISRNIERLPTKGNRLVLSSVRITHYGIDLRELTKFYANSGRRNIAPSGQTLGKDFRIDIAA